MRTLRLVACLVIQASIIPAFADDSPSEENLPLSERLRAYLAKQSEGFTTEASLGFYSQLGDDELGQLANYRRADVAIRSRWELLSREPESQDRKSAFLVAVVEGTGVTPPDWWMKGVFGAKARGGNRHHVFYRIPAESFPKYSHQFGGWFAQKGQRLRFGEEGVDIVAAGRELSIPPSGFAERVQPDSNCAAFVYHSDDSSYLLVHRESPSPYSVFRVDRESGDVHWEARVYGQACTPIATGPWIAGGRWGTHAATIVLNSNKVVVFGGHDCCAYVEAFDSANGEVLFRFSTGY